MSRKTLMIAALMFLIASLAIALITKDALAAANISADKDLASKKGVGASLGTKKFDKEKLPGRLKISFAFGSLFAAIAVIKWL